MDRAAARRRVQALGKRSRAWRSDPEGSLAATADLVRMAQAGDAEAEGEVMEAHAGQIRDECRRLRVPRSDVDDFVQAGKMSMRYPIHRFDASRGLPLWFYARPFVRRGIIYSLGKTLGLTRHQAREYRPVWRAHDALVSEGVEPTPATIRRRVFLDSRRDVGAPTIEAILSAGRRWLFPFDDQRDSGRG